MIACEAKSATVTGLLSPFCERLGRTSAPARRGTRARPTHRGDRGREISAAVAHRIPRRGRRRAEHAGAAAAAAVQRAAPWRIQ
jgi:hypothetical protein